MARYPLVPGAGRTGKRPALFCDALPGVAVPGQLIGIGENYAPDPTEPGTLPKTQPSRMRGRTPLVFGKFSGSVAASGQDVVLLLGMDANVVCEGELAVVIGTTLKDASGTEEALAALAGVTVANDISARDLQAADVQSTRGKSLDTFCPLGPDLVTLDELGDLQQLGIRTLINGETVQESYTGMMIFSVAELVLFCSQFMTLYPGDVILTGTPWAVDESTLTLSPGDTVSIEIARVGTLSNPVVLHLPA